MRLDHVALWVSDLDAAARFWEQHFGATSGDVYQSQRQPGFMSRFATIQPSQLKIELMTKPGLRPAEGERCGWAHIAISLGSKAAVDEAAKRFDAENRLILGPRTTGDGYYEAVVLGPDELHVELVV